MTGFEFHTVKQLLNQPGAIARLGELCAQLQITRPLIVTDPGMVSAGLLDRASSPLQDAGLPVSVFTDVQADPPESVVQAAINFARHNRIDGVIGFGGGSAMDTAKLVALIVRSSEELGEIYGVDRVRGSRLPLIQVPTTAGTGSEVTPIAIVTTGQNGTTGKHSKMGVVSNRLLPDVALLDAELTVGLPAPVTASTGIDAMVHAVEAYTSVHKKNPYSDMLACQALSLLAGNIRQAVSEPNDIQARQQMLFGAMLAGQAFANAPVAAVHALAYPLGGQFHISHGLSNSLVLPAVLRFNSAVAAPLYAALAPHVMGEHCPRGSSVEVAEALVGHFEQLIGELALPTRLRELDIPESALPHLAEAALEQQRLLVNNPREVTHSDALEIYQSVY